MPPSHVITVNGQSFRARQGEVLLDAALANGVAMPFDCRAGHCGTCCVRLVSGSVRGGEGTEPGIVHACQCRIFGDATLERDDAQGVRIVARALPYHAGQYAKVGFKGFPSRPFSITLPLQTARDQRLVWFHIRRMAPGGVTAALGKSITIGHAVTLEGPYGSAHYRANSASRMVLVATNTGFAPIWSIAVAALRENPQRLMMIIAGGRSLDALYMGPALAQLTRFPNVHIIPVCSAAHNLPKAVMPGRPTDYLPILLPSDVLYACGAPGMVEAVKTIAAKAGAVCYADPFVAARGSAEDNTQASRLTGWLTWPVGRRVEPVAAFSMNDVKVRSHRDARRA
jgi:ferredoxin-NAD(P)+ reductase (naphthalene dioxygenase ferredoxin-specific)